MSIEIPDEPSVIAQTLYDYIYLFFGPPGVGKTTFIRKVFGKQKTLFLSTDRGTRDQDARRVEVHSWKDVRAVFKKLESNLHEVQVLVFDHVDDMAGMVEEYVCNFYTKKDKSGNVFESIDEVPHGKGWALLKRELASMVQRTLRLGVTPVFIAHEDMKTVMLRGREVLRTGPSMSKQAQRYINPVANIIGQITLKRMALEKGGQKEDVRILTTQPREDLYCKDRTARRKSDKGWEVLDAKAFRASFEPERTVRKGRRARD